MNEKMDLAISQEGSTQKRSTIQQLKQYYSVKSLFTVKPIEDFLQTRTKESSLAEKLGLIDLLAYGVGGTVGAGIYSLIGIGAGIAGTYVHKLNFHEMMSLSNLVLWRYSNYYSIKIIILLSN